MRDRVFLGLGCIAVFGLSCATAPRPVVAPPRLLAPAPSPETAAPPPPAARVEPPEPGSGLRLKVLPADARVRVDERPYGRVGEIGDGSGILALEPGVHRICLERAGYQTWRGEVTVGERTELLEVQLEKTR